MDIFVWFQNQSKGVISLTLSYGRLFNLVLHLFERCNNNDDTKGIHSTIKKNPMNTATRQIIKTVSCVKKNLLVFQVQIWARNKNTRLARGSKCDLIYSWQNRHKRILRCNYRDVISYELHFAVSICKALLRISFPHKNNVSGIVIKNK